MRGVRDMKTESKYEELEGKIGRCPKCGGNNLVFGEGELLDMFYRYEVICKSCGFEGHEWYYLTFHGYGHFPDDNREIVEKTINKTT